MTQGVESFVAYQPLKSVTLRLDYTYTEATDEILHEELLRRPKHKASLNGNWQATQRLSFNATVLTVSSWIDGNRDFTIPRLTAPGYTTVKPRGQLRCQQRALRLRTDRQPVRPALPESGRIPAALAGRLCGNQGEALSGDLVCRRGVSIGCPQGAGQPRGSVREKHQNLFSHLSPGHAGIVRRSGAQQRFHI